MRFRRWGVGCCECGVPLVMISTCDSSVNYTYLCPFEQADGTPGNSCSPGWDQFDPDGSCVLTPIQADIDKWNADLMLWNDAKDRYEKDYPTAAGIISGGYRCWAGVQAAIYPTGETWATDTYGDFEYASGGYDANNRITLSNLQDMFTTLHAKHELEEDEPFGFLWVIDNTGSITVAQWGTNVKADFLSWIASTYPECEVKEIQLNNYLVDGEDWLRHFAEYYTDVGKRGLN